jgi:hypothetical protein
MSHVQGGSLGKAIFVDDSGRRSRISGVVLGLGAGVGLIALVLVIVSLFGSVPLPALSHPSPSRSAVTPHPAAGSLLEVASKRSPSHLTPTQVPMPPPPTSHAHKPSGVST